LGHSVSAVGDQVLYVALIFTAAQVAPPAVAGLIIACTVLPNAVLTLLGGAIVDRTDARRVMITSDVVQLLVMVTALVVLTAYGASVWLLIALALVFGAASAFYDPASFALPRQLRPTGDLTRVAGIRQLASRVGAVGGPPLGGLLVAAFGLAGALTFDVVTFSVIAVVLLLVVRPRWPRTRATGQTVLGDIRGGLSYVWSTPRVRNLVIALAGMNVFTAPVIAVGLALRTSQAGWGPATLGALMGSLGAAAILGTMVMVRLRPSRPVLVALLLMLVSALSLVAVGLAPFAGVLAATFAIGLTAGLASPLLSGAFQASVDEAYLARAGSVISISDSAVIPISMTGFGLLAGVTSVAAACVVFGIGFAVQLSYSLSHRYVRALRADGSTGTVGDSSP
jgi:MFS family permease